MRYRSADGLAMPGFLQLPSEGRKFRSKPEHFIALSIFGSLQSLKELQRYTLSRLQTRVRYSLTSAFVIFVTPLTLDLRVRLLARFLGRLFRRAEIDFVGVSVSYSSSKSAAATERRRFVPRLPCVCVTAFQSCSPRAGVPGVAKNVWRRTVLRL
jgi:hypothetical protein